MKAGAGRFKKPPAIPKKKYPSRPTSHVSINMNKGVEEEVGVEDEDDDVEEVLSMVEPKYFRLTSLRMLVWINFILVVLLIFSFLLYIVTRPSHHSPLPVEKTATFSREQKVVLFNLVPEKESNDRWALLSLKSSAIDARSLEKMWVCCTKDDIYSCDDYSVSFSANKMEAKISIRHPDRIGATCRLFWV